jgi:formyltetrahydrofolate deformylase
MKKSRTYTLTISCPDRGGIVAAVSGLLAAHKGWIIESSHHADREAKRFFMRDEILADSLPFELETLREKFAPIAQEFQMDWKITDSAVKKKLILMVSQQDHCLADILQRWRSGEMDFELCAVISNHDALRSFVEWHNVPFHHVPLEKNNELFLKYQPDVIVLARYMQILPPNICEEFFGKIINIHHSFLPSFSGAKPYHQAFDLGVKLIGATCHYVTAELDAGPIIEQDLIRVEHSDTVDNMVRLGRDIEKIVLARGLHYHLQNRVLINHQKTIVFR